MTARYALIYEDTNDPDDPLLFRSLDPDAVAFFDAHPELPQVVRAIFAVYRRNGGLDACKAVDVARALENSLRAVSRISDLVVRPRWELRETGSFLDPGTGMETKIKEQFLVDIETARIVEYGRKAEPRP